MHIYTAIRSYWSREDPFISQNETSLEIGEWKNRDDSHKFLNIIYSCFFNMFLNEISDHHHCLLHAGFDNVIIHVSRLTTSGSLSRTPSKHLTIRMPHLVSRVLCVIDQIIYTVNLVVCLNWFGVKI